MYTENISSMPYDLDCNLLPLGSNNDENYMVELLCIKYCVCARRLPVSIPPSLRHNGSETRQDILISLNKLSSFATSPFYTVL